MGLIFNRPYLNTGVVRIVRITPIFSKQSVKIRKNPHNPYHPYYQLLQIQIISAQKKCPRHFTYKENPLLLHQAQQWAAIARQPITTEKMQDILFDFISKYVFLTTEEKNTIISLDIFRSVRKGTILLKEGQRSKDSYFVLKGCIRSYYVLDGEEKTTAFYTEVEGLTPHCVISKTPSEYYVSCVEDTILTVSNADMEVTINRKFPKFETMCRILAEELLSKQRVDFDAFKTSSPEQRYLNLMQKRPDLIQRVPQHQLASFLGIKPQSLSRLRARILEKKG